MVDLEHKKLALLHILDILKYHSDFNHPLTQQEIIDRLESDYGILVERKTISRNIALLKEAGINIESDKRGTYFDDYLLDDSQIHLLIDSILASKHISESQSKELINKISSLSNKYFKKHIKNIHSLGQRDKTDNKQLFYNIEIIDEAIEKNKQIEYTYNKFGLDKKLHKSAVHKVSPYQLLLHNQRYYLMGRDEKWKNLAYHRVDKITDIKIIDAALVDIRTIKGYENGINYKELSTQMPYFNSTERPKTIEFYCDEVIINDIIDWFGKDVVFKEEKGKIRVTIKANPVAVVYWMLQFIQHIEVVGPKSVKDRIVSILKESLKRNKLL